MKQIDMILDHLGDIRARRAVWEDHWNDCAKYTQPRKADINQRGANPMPGQKQTSTLYDGTAIEANEFFASAMHGLLVSHKDKWFSIESVDDNLNERQAVQEWYEDVTKKMHAEIHNPKAKFTENLDEVLLDLGSFGTGILEVERGTNSFLRFDSSSVKEEYLTENEDGVIDTSYKVFEWKAHQIASKFPDTAMNDPEVAKAMSPGGNKETPIEVIHAVYPRKGRDPSKEDNLNLPWAAVYATTRNKVIFEESGFHEFPKMTPRWRKRANEVYGRGPCMNVLPDIKMLQTMERQLILANELILNPPLDVPSKGYVGKIKAYAGAVNYRKAPGNERMQVVNTIGSLPIPENKADQKRDAIRRGFYNHLFTLPEDGQQTATEVIERRAEKFQVIMPMAGRSQSELMGPMLERVFAMMFREKMFGDPPDELRGTATRVRYLSRLAQIQAHSDAEPILQTFGAAGQIAQLDAEILDNFDLDKATRLLAKSFHFPASAYRKDEDIQGRREQRREAAQQANRREAAKDAAEVVNKTSGQGNGPEDRVGQVMGQVFGNG